MTTGRHAQIARLFVILGLPLFLSRSPTYHQPLSFAILLLEASLEQSLGRYDRAYSYPHGPITDHYLEYGFRGCPKAIRLPLFTPIRGTRSLLLSYTTNRLACYTHRRQVSSSIVESLRGIRIIYDDSGAFRVNTQTDNTCQIATRSCYIYPQRDLKTFFPYGFSGTSFSTFSRRQQPTKPTKQQKCEGTVLFLSALIRSSSIEQWLRLL